MPSKRRKFQAFPSDRVWVALESARGNTSKSWGEVLEELILGDTQGDTQPDIRGQLEAIERRLSALEKARESPTNHPRVTPGATQVSPVNSTKESPGDTQGITQAELCDRYGLGAANIVRTAKAAGQTSQEYLESKTGWRRQGRKWYPSHE
ncbi:MAG: hypothetical protein ACFCBU_10195 [Cyanophyceae cyanobacterium]